MKVLLGLLFVFVVVNAQNCPVSVSNQIIRGSVFSRDFQIEKIVQGNSVPSIKATWEFQYPNCYIRVTITFKDSSNNIVGETVITQNVNTITEIIQTVSVCNDMVSATFEASDGSTSFVKNSLQRVYTGGDPSSRPSGAPRQLQAGQDPQNPQRVLLTWSPLPCLLSNAPVTRYVIQFERQGVATPRVAATSALSIKSSASTRPTGLGFIDQNVVYYFRVAAQNANGIGPFSGDQLARTANTPTEQPVAPTTIPPPTTEAPRTTAPPPTTPTFLPTTPTYPPTTPPPTTSPPSTPPSTTPQISPPSSKPRPPTSPTALPITLPTTPPQANTQRSPPGGTVPPLTREPLTSGKITTTEQSETVKQEVTVTNNAGGKGSSDTLAAELNRSPSTGSMVGIVVSVLLVVILLVAFIFVAFGIIIWRYKSVLKKQSYNVRAMDDTLMEVNRESFILSMNTPPPTLPSIITKMSFDEEIKAIEPTITSYKSNVYTNEGDEITLQVDFNGTPDPSITWFFNGIRLDDANSSGQEVGDDGSLHIAQVSRDHAGTYDFIVSNSGGSVEGCTKLIVYLRERTERKVETSKIYSKQIGEELFGEYVAKNHENGDSGFAEEFENLSSGEAGQKAMIGRSVTNRHCNRFRNILCYDTNRIELEPIPKYPDMQMDYINASYVDGFVRAKNYIATQAPLSQTIADFWHLVWQEKVQVIVMLNSAAEGKLKRSEIYWPEGSSREYGPFMVTLVECQMFADYTIRTMQLVASKDMRQTVPFRNIRKITQFHFTSWPDSGVPEYAGPLLMFQRRVKSHHKPTKGPILVHCDGGVGKTGMYIAIDNALAQAARDSVVDIAGVVCQMRRQRMKMVQGRDQYVFIHDAVLESLMCGNTQIPAASMRKAVVRLAEVDPRTRANGYQTQYHVLEQVSPNPSDVVRTTAAAYPDRNRSSDFLPPDKWRVVLKAKNLNETYVHASYANGYKQKKGFIVAQAPMRNTTEEFWKMVYEKEVAVIVMLSLLEEDGKEACHQYWPGSANIPGIDGEQYGLHTIYTLQTKRQDGFTIRNFGITNPNTPNMRKVMQFQMTNWTREGICSDPKTVMKMIDQLLIAQMRTGNKPIVIHGVDTVTRCGVFCALLSSIEHCKTDSVVDIFQIVKGLRIQKPGIVQTVEQYQFVHDLMVLFLSCFSLYSNFK